MVLMVLIAVALTGATVALIVRAVALPRIDAAARLTQIEAYGFAPDAATASSEPKSRGSLIDRLALSVGGVVAGHWKACDEAEIRKTLMTAGLYGTTPMTFLGYRALSSVTLPLTILWYLTATGTSGAMFVVGLGFGVFAGWTLPMTIVSRRARHRYEKVERDLPELIDLLVVTVEAGLGLSGAIQVVAHNLHGPLGDEVRLTLQEQRMGLSMNEALSNMLVRCETPSMRSFVRSVLQGETLGVSIGQIMRALAMEMRKRRRAAAEERAQKAPIKMLFPLVFLIFPSMFVVLLFPAMYSFVTTLGGK
jgi:tight adherence protein C